MKINPNVYETAVGTIKLRNMDLACAGCCSPADAPGPANDIGTAVLRKRNTIQVIRVAVVNCIVDRKKGRRRLNIIILLDVMENTAAEYLCNVNIRYEYFCSKNSKMFQ